MCVTSLVSASTTICRSNYADQQTAPDQPKQHIGELYVNKETGLAAEYDMSTKRQNHENGDFGAVDVCQNPDESGSAERKTEETPAPCKETRAKTGYKQGGLLRTVDEEIDPPANGAPRNKTMARSFSSFDLHPNDRRMKRGGRASLQMAFSQTVKLFKTA